MAIVPALNPVILCVTSVIPTLARVILPPVAARVTRRAVSGGILCCSHAAAPCAAVRRSASDHGFRAMPAAIAGVIRIDLWNFTKL